MVDSVDQLAELFRCVLLACGLIYLLTRSAVFRPYRLIVGRLHMLVFALVYCPACTGFWVGVAVGAYAWPYTSGWLACLESGIACCGLGSVLGEIWSTDLTAEFQRLGYSDGRANET